MKATQETPREKSSLGYFNWGETILNSFLMLSPHIQYKNPVMFVTYLSAILATVCAFIGKESSLFGFETQIALWLWFTVLFANFSQAIAESRGRAQAASLRKTKSEAFAKKIVNGKVTKIPATELRKDDVVLCEIGDIIPADGDVLEGIATVDESAITGESAPVIRESGGDRCAVTAGTRIVSDSLKVKVTSDHGNTFLDHMISLIEGAQRQRTPNELALNIFLVATTIIFLLVIVSLKLFADYSAGVVHQNIRDVITVPILSALFVCLIPTTISALLSAVGIAGMDRLIRCNVVAKSGRSVEAAGDIDMLILDKTGTITIGNRMATAFFPMPGVDPKHFAEIAQLASLADETPEGRSIVVLAKNEYGLRAESLNTANAKIIPFSSVTRMSGIDTLDNNKRRQIRKGASDSIKAFVEAQGGVFPSQAEEWVQKISRQGGTPLLVCDGPKVVGAIQLSDVLKGGIRERFAEMRRMGIRTVMITGDNPLTAAAIAAEAGVDDFIAEATPEMKLSIIKKAQEEGRLVAMTGDGTNDAPALAQADVGVAMNTGTQASREAGNMVDLDSNPTKLIDIVKIGKQLLMTRGALTTFSIANDIAKYFAIIPAIFGGLYLTDSHEGALSILNIMMLHSQKSAILSAVIFNALIIIALIPLALRGVSYRADSADHLLRKNLFIYGLGGVLLPFIGIKLIDMIITFTNII